MLSAVYKSTKKEQMYLFVKKRDDFSKVPEALMQSFGQPQLVSVINLASRDHLGFADINKVKQALVDTGFYLQLPPPVENLLNAHKQSAFSSHSSNQNQE